MAIAKVLLSGSTGGRGVLVAATASTGTTIHATGTSDTTIDVVTLYAHNSSTSAVTLVVEFGGTTDPGDTITLTVPADSGLTLVVPDLPLTGTGAAARTITAYAGTANVVSVFGYVNRLT